MTRLGCYVIGGFVCAALVASPCAGQTWRNDFSWSHVGAAGNRGATAQESPAMPGIGAVAYEFDIMTTPVTVAQYWEFVQAYAPFYEHRGINRDMTGDWIFMNAAGQLTAPGAAAMQRPATPAWEYAARFVNWVHNGKVNEAWAFEGGVYDTATFTENSDGTYNHDTTPADGATVWIPTLDEYTKAFHYDPNKDGDGEPGYWRYPHSSDTAPVPGWPDGGGETDAGDIDFVAVYQDVGSYPWAVSPWGVLDSSGGRLEWTGSSEFGSGRIMVPDSDNADLGWELDDRLDFDGTWLPDSHGCGFRLATSVPGPSVLPAFVCVMVHTFRRKGRRHEVDTPRGARGGGGVRG